MSNIPDKIPLTTRDDSTCSCDLRDHIRAHDYI